MPSPTALPPPQLAQWLAELLGMVRIASPPGRVKDQWGIRPNQQCDGTTPSWRAEEGRACGGGRAE